MDCHFLLQGIFLTQGSNPGLLQLLRCRVDSLPLSHLGSPSSQSGPLPFNPWLGLWPLPHPPLRSPHKGQRAPDAGDTMRGSGWALPGRGHGNPRAFGSAVRCQASPLMAPTQPWALGSGLGLRSVNGSDHGCSGPGGAERCGQGGPGLPPWAVQMGGFAWFSAPVETGPRSLRAARQSLEPTGSLYGL